MRFAGDNSYALNRTAELKGDDRVSRFVVSRRNQTRIDGGFGFNHVIAVFSIARGLRRVSVARGEDLPAPQAEPELVPAYVPVRAEHSGRPHSLA